MTEREWIDDLRRIGREQTVDMFHDFFRLSGGWGAGRSQAGCYDQSCDCPHCRQARGCWSPAYDGDSLYQLARLHAEGVGHLMRLGANALRHLHGLGGPACWPSCPPAHASSGCQPCYRGAPGDQWPGEGGGDQRRHHPAAGSHRQHAEFCWSGSRDQVPVYQFIVQNQDPHNQRRLDVSVGQPSPSGHRPTVTGSAKCDPYNLDPWAQAMVRVTFDIQHCAAGSVCLPVSVYLDGKLVATHWAKLSVKG